MQINRILVGLAVIGLTTLGQAQQELSDLVEEAGAGAMFGDWAGETPNGEAIGWTLAWDLNKHVIASHLKSPQLEVKAMTALDPESGEPKLHGFSNRGGAMTGVWTLWGPDVMLKWKAISPEGRTWDGATIYQQVDHDTLRLQMCQQDDAGDPVTPPRSTITLKRKQK